MVELVLTRRAHRPRGGASWAGGRRARSSVPALLAAIVLGTATFAGFGLAMAGSLRAEAVLVLANVLFLAVWSSAGVLVPVAQLPEPLATIAAWLPPAALTAALGGALGSAADRGAAWLILLVWSAIAVGLAVRTFHWDDRTPPVGTNGTPHGDAIGYRARPDGRAEIEATVDQRGLVEQAQRGDHDAFAALAGAAIARLDAAARLILRDHELARDAVQDALVRAWRDLPDVA